MFFNYEQTCGMDQPSGEKSEEMMLIDNTHYWNRNFNYPYFKIKKKDLVFEDLKNSDSPLLMYTVSSRLPKEREEEGYKISKTGEASFNYIDSDTHDKLPSGLFCYCKFEENEGFKKIGLYSDPQGKPYFKQEDGSYKTDDGDPIPANAPKHPSKSLYGILEEKEFLKLPQPKKVEPSSLHNVLKRLKDCLNSLLEKMRLKKK